MPRETPLIATLARIARIPFWAKGNRPFVTPRKALILKPCCISQVMLATPMLAVLKNAFPTAQFDWAVGDWARPAIIGNPRVSQLISTGTCGLETLSWREMISLANRIGQEGYDTCFIPSRSSLLAWLAWWAGIPQRIGLNVSGRGFAHTTAVKPPNKILHESELYLTLAKAVGIDTTDYSMEFYPPDADRTAIAERLIDVTTWSSGVPLVIMHPGGGTNPRRLEPSKQWPIERYVRLSNYLTRHHGAQIILVGASDEKALTHDIVGMMSAPMVDWAGRLTIGEVGALSEVADLYIGNDAGATHVAAAVGCPTLAIFGPSDPAVSRPFGWKGEVTALWHDVDICQPFSWEGGVTVKEAIKAADALLAGRS